jgi:LmbE family N-acetylglucosaminyl deacetylase
VTELLVDTPERALAVYAHPDDADVSCGGTMARWSAAGAAVHLLICTTGDKGTRDALVEPAELAERRAAEVAAAAGVTGLRGHENLGYADGELVDDAELRGELVGWIRRLRPQVVLCPDPSALFFGEDYYNHREHRLVGSATLDALAPAAALPHYFPDSGPPHQAGGALLSGTLTPSVWVDITGVIDVKVDAVACHRSQFPGDGGWVREAVTVRAAEEGRRAGVP